MSGRATSLTAARLGADADSAGSSLPHPPADRAAACLELQAEASAHLDRLPVLRRQLTDTVQQVEEAVVQIGSEFEGLVAEILSGAEESAELLTSNERHAGLQELIDSAERSLEMLLQQVRRSESSAAAAGQKMAAAADNIRRVNSIVERFDDVALDARLLGVNAKIEAVRLEGRGHGFAEVANQISEFSRNSARMAAGIRLLIEEIVPHVNETSRALDEMAAENRTFIAKQQDRIESLLGDFRTAHQAIESFMVRSHEHNRGTAGKISRSVVGLQFQDRMSQRIQHVVDALEELESDLSRPLAKLGAGWQERSARQQEVVRLDRDRYTMDAERAVEFGGAAALPGSEEDDGVELF